VERMLATILEDLGRKDRGLVAGDQVALLVNGLGGAPQDGDLFGRALAAGDFDADGRMDLAIGVPGETSVEQEDAGIVQVTLRAFLNPDLRAGEDAA